MNSVLKIHPKCGHKNNTKTNKCTSCFAILKYGRDYYKFKNFLLYLSLPGLVIYLTFEIFSIFNIVSVSFLEKIPDWLFGTVISVMCIGYILYLIIVLADLDEEINE